MKELKVFNNQEVLGKEFKIYGDVDAPLFLAKDVAEWIDYGVSNVSKMVKNVDEDEKIMARTNNTSATFLTEDGLYEVLMLSRKPIAKAFKKEVKSILKQLRKTGVVITEKATVEDINYEAMFGNYRIRKTFRECKATNVKEFYNTFVVESKNNKIKAEDMIKKNNLIVKELQEMISPISLAEGKIGAGEILFVRELINDIQDRTLELSNRRNGGLRSAKTKEIKALKGTINSMKEPSLEMYNKINYAPLSVNKMFDGEGSVKHRSPLYNYWIENFPFWEVEDKELWELNGVDFNEPLHIRLGFVCHELNDIDNLCKSTIDMVLGRIYGVNDVLVHKVTADKIGTNNDKLGQKIYIHISNL